MSVLHLLMCLVVLDLAVIEDDAGETATKG